MRYLLLIFLSLFTVAATAQRWSKYKPFAPAADSMVQRIILIGDAGELAPDKHHPVVEAVEELIPMDKRTTVLYLGDNLYYTGLPNDQLGQAYADAKAVLDSQINIADHGPGMVYMIPGNHDWMNGAKGGWEAVKRQQRYVSSVGKPNLRFEPEDGCPGPVEIDIDSNVVMILMDSQWWIHHNDKPGIESDCDQKSQQEIISELKDIVNRNYRKLIIFACHHPFRSSGIHGGYFTLKQHIFPFTDVRPNLYIPLPFLGSIYPISRGVFGVPEDIAYPEYTNMIKTIDEVLKGAPYVIHVAGHEHNLQWIQEDSNQNYIVSGAGCKHSRVSRSKTTLFGTASSGFAVLDVYKNKNVQVTFYTVAPDSFGQIYTGQVFNFSNIPEPERSDTTEPVFSFKDSVVAPASTQYRKSGLFRSFIEGRNYRKEWSEPVAFKTFHLKKEKGGLRIVGMGGGLQTKSLHMVDASGKEWNLRTIDKDPGKAIPIFLRGSIAEEVTQDMISAAHPYSPMAVPVLARAAGVITSDPQFFYVPDDPALGYYRTLFANKICLLEPQNPSIVQETKSTSRLFDKMRDDNDRLVDQPSVLRARLLDFLIADWDRHFDQWRWAEADTGIGSLYYPIPRDRDQAFFLSDGLLMKTMGKRFFPWMRGFRSDMKKVNQLAFSARDFDRLFMNHLDKKQWSLAIDTFVNVMSDSVLGAAIHQMPDPIKAIDSATIYHTLQARRDLLQHAALKYYDFISKKVTILGSNGPEYFSVTGNDSGALVQVFTRCHKTYCDTTMLIYTRQLLRSETKELRIYGLNGDDHFYVDSNVKHLRLRLVGGRGIDTFDLHGRSEKYMYDITTEKNQFLSLSRTHNRLSSNPTDNEYSLPDYQYNITRFPWINLAYNPDDGLFFGLGYYRKTFGFRKSPFETEHRLNLLYALHDNAYAIKYNGTFVGISQKYSLRVDGSLKNPALSNFFGLGNETHIDPAEGAKFYRVRYKFLEGDVLIQRNFGNVLSIGVGPAFQYYWYKDRPNEGKVFEHPELVGLTPEEIHDPRMHVGGKGVITINNVNNELFPTRGIFWVSEIAGLGAVRGVGADGKNTHALVSAQSHMTVYASLREPARLVTVVRLGGGKIFTKDYEYYQALGLGESNFLRGFRKNRFAGDAIAYGSLEMRLKVADIKGHVLPGQFGLIGYDDAGRVWFAGEESKKWHNAIGGGVYFIPYNLFIIGLTGTKSPEEFLFNISVGTKLNVVF